MAAATQVKPLLIHHYGVGHIVVGYLTASDRPCLLTACGAQLPWTAESLAPSWQPTVCRDCMANR